MAFSGWWFTGGVFSFSVQLLVLFSFYNKQIFLKSPKEEVINDKNIGKSGAVSVLPEPSGKLPS